MSEKSQQYDDGKSKLDRLFSAQDKTLKIQRLISEAIQLELMRQSYPSHQHKEADLEAILRELEDVVREVRKVRDRS